MSDNQEKQLALPDRLKGLSRSHGRDVIRDEVTIQYGPKVLELFEFAIKSAETTAEFLQVIDKIKDFMGVPKQELMDATAEGAKIATVSMLAALQGIGQIMGKKIEPMEQVEPIETIVQEEPDGKPGQPEQPAEPREPGESAADVFRRLYG